MKKLMYTLGAFAASAPMALLAEGGDNTQQIVPISEVTKIFTQAEDNMTSLLDVAIPVVCGFVGGGLIIWGAISLVGVLKRAFGAGKGR